MRAHRPLVDGLAFRYCARRPMAVGLVLVEVHAPTNDSAAAVRRYALTGRQCQSARGGPPRKRRGMVGE